MEEGRAHACPALSVRDNDARDDDVLALFDAQVRGGAATGDGAPAKADGPVTRVSYPASGFIATPRDTGLRGDDLDALIARQRDHFAALGTPVEWKTYAYDEPGDLTDRLVEAGFQPEEPETVLVGTSVDLVGLASDVSGVEFRETDDPRDLFAIGILNTDVWGEDWSWIAADLQQRIDAMGPDGIRVLVAEADGAVISAAWLVMRRGGDFAGLWGGSTRSDWRGRGVYRALVARRAEIARELGFRYLQVDASDMSHPILERLGFRAITQTTPYVWTPPRAGSPAPASPADGASAASA